MNADAPHGTMKIFLPPGSPAEMTWWETYHTHLNGISGPSQEVIEADAQLIVERGIFGDGDPADGGWGPSRQRSGLVMGAVQSGKTASMLAVTAKAIDHGVDAVVILAGTRTALWKQTYERATAQLAFGENNHKRRLLVPRHVDKQSVDIDIDLLYRVGAPAAIRHALKQRKPVLAIVMKNWAHLQRVASVLRDVYGCAQDRDKAFHLLVIDDEADDSSVVDAAAESAAPMAEPKQVPRRIVDIWEDRSRRGETVKPNLFATYLAYTATPQANFLQDAQNPLAPRDFVASLRTPGSDGVVGVRSPTFRVEGIENWYTGGEVFYRTLASVPLCVPTDDIEPAEQVPAALRAFFVASAIRLLRTSGRLGPREAQTTAFASMAEAKQRCPDVASMLIHPSSGLDDHFKVAQELIRWSAGSTEGSEPADVDTQFDRQLGVPGVVQDMTAHPDRWTQWLDDYARAEEAVRAVPHAGKRETHAPFRWPEVRDMILTEIVPATSVRVINSHEDADDRPEYEPAPCDDGTVRAPRNLSTIFVSGNVMSRGLTLEGLTTTLFTRRAGVPFADTQMQMQRWFGYRGAYIDLCRVFIPRDLLDNFISFHEDDEALRRDVLERMEADAALPDVSVLQGRSYRSTGKIANLRGESLFPGPRPFVSHMNDAGDDDHNLMHIAGVLSSNTEVVAHPRGLLLNTPLTLLKAAELLDGLRYTHHGPGVAGPESERWRSVASHAGLSGDPVAPLYRAPMVPHGVDLGRKSPYWIAAYLRFWHACLIRNVDSIVTTDDPPARWSLVDLQVKAAESPRFWVGMRFGEGVEITNGPLAALQGPVRPMRRKTTNGNMLAATWGTRGRGPDGGIRGDDVFDYLARGREPRTTAGGDRRAGEDGLILFHPVEHSPGVVTMAVGVSIPLGGPDQTRAVPGGARG